MSTPPSEPVEVEAVGLRKLPWLLFVRGIALLSVVLGLAAGLHWYLGLRLIRDAGVQGAAATAGWWALCLLFLATPGGVILGRSARPAVAHAARSLAYGWMGALALLLPATALADLVAFGLKLGGRPVSGATEAAWVLGWTVLAGGWAVYSARRPRVVRRELVLPRLPRALDGLRVAQISDIHIGESLGADFLEQVVLQVNRLEADLVAVTGDLVEGPPLVVTPMLEPLRALRAKLGVFYVTGNHEYYHGGPVWERAVERLGLTVLHNAHRVVSWNGGTLVVAGVTDHDAGHFGEEHQSRPDLAFAGAPDEGARLLLAHQPRSAKQAAPHRVDLQLSGHTHGGQIWPWNLLVPLQQPAVAGLKELFGVQVYTHRGTGYWGPPLRLGAPPEIALLTLRAR